jgi:ADP-heptose:LPS heptosyltransferase
MSFSSALIAYLGGTGRRIGYRGGGRGWLITDPVSMESHRKMHLSEEFARFAGKYSGYLPDTLPEPCVVPPYDWKESIAGLRIDGGYAVLAAGAK